MRKVAIKALYLFLCSILGMVLFAMLHRAIFVLYDLVLIYDFNTYSLGMSEAMILAVDFLTMILALFLGGWYGTVLGLDWYALVYGPNAETKAGLFHGFLPHNWRTPSAGKSATPMVATAPITIKPAAKVVPPKPVIKTVIPKAVAVTKTTASKVSIQKPAVKPTPAPKPVMTNSEWNFDDFLKATPAPKKRAIPAKKAVATTPKTTTTTTKTVRKTVAKKSNCER